MKMRVLALALLAAPALAGCPGGSRSTCMAACPPEPLGSFTDCVSVCSSLCDGSTRRRMAEGRRGLQQDLAPNFQADQARNQCLTTRYFELDERMDELEDVVNGIAGPALGSHNTIVQILSDVGILQDAVVDLQNQLDLHAVKVFVPTVEPTLGHKQFQWKYPEVQPASMSNSDRKLTYLATTQTWGTYRTTEWVRTGDGRQEMTVQFGCLDNTNLNGGPGCLAMIGAVPFTYTHYNSHQRSGSSWTWYVHAPGSTTYSRQMYGPIVGTWEPANPGKPNAAVPDAWTADKSSEIVDGDFMTVILDPDLGTVEFEWSRDAQWNGKFTGIPQSYWDAGVAFAISPYYTNDFFNICPAGQRTC